MEKKDQEAQVQIEVLDLQSIEVVSGGHVDDKVQPMEWSTISNVCNIGNSPQ